MEGCGVGSKGWGCSVAQLLARQPSPGSNLGPALWEDSSPINSDVGLYTERVNKKISKKLLYVPYYNRYSRKHKFGFKNIHTVKQINFKMSSSNTRIPCPRPVLIANFFVGKSNLRRWQKGFQLSMDYSFWLYNGYIQKDRSTVTCENLLTEKSLQYNRGGPILLRGQKSEYWERNLGIWWKRERKNSHRPLRASIVWTQ